jgi:hypothetical protein
MDALRLLAEVSCLQAQDSSNSLQDVAKEQQTELKKKQQIRAVQEEISKIGATSDYDPAEMAKLNTMMDEIHCSTDVNAQNFTTASDGKIHTDDQSDKTQRDNKAKFQALSDAVKDQMDSATDDQQDLQFRIQTATSDMTNAQSMASQAEKRVDDARSEIRKNWSA